ncbi:hypothetical protein [Mesorhizobium sp.]|uniref:hypothetical protein n=1 Tax=Mesorhizobium sp. TaxID=1871066 RepID=UPI000FE7DC6C|nr:hypothetical protein [Mesorhizobium sp.]RWE42285.1 MAG: hypothetical protein EOS80_25950 [Mesorhizobium sp.]
MARVDIVRVETPEGAAVRGGDPVMVTVKVAPGWFEDADDLAIRFIYADTLEGTDYVSVYKEITIDSATEISFRVKAKHGSSPGEYYVQIKKESTDETVASDPGDGTITVS